MTRMGRVQRKNKVFGNRNTPPNVLMLINFMLPDP